jgi:hypothetical protein
VLHRRRRASHIAGKFREPTGFRQSTSDRYLSSTPAQRSGIDAQQAG